MQTDTPPATPARTAGDELTPRPLPGRARPRPGAKKIYAVPLDTGGYYMVSSQHTAHRRP